MLFHTYQEYRYGQRVHEVLKAEYDLTERLIRSSIRPGFVSIYGHRITGLVRKHFG